jgi:hypothetical protein
MQLGGMLVNLSLFPPTVGNKVEFRNHQIAGSWPACEATVGTGGSVYIVLYRTFSYQQGCRPRRHRFEA